MLFSPLEQYKLVYIANCPVNSFDFSLTVLGIVLGFIVFGILFLYCIFFFNIQKIKLISQSLYYMLELFYSFILTMIKNILPSQSIVLFPFFFVTFFFIFLSNTIGLIPYSYTITSQLYFTLFFALSYFGWIVYLGFSTYGVKFFSILLPPSTSFLLSFLIVPIELISYCFRPISLAVRLFANMMAGHALLKVIVSFAWKLLLVGSLIHTVTFGLLLLLFFLEFAVACIQAYVFSMLVLLYVNDIFNLH